MSEYVRKQVLLDRLDELIGYFGGNSFLARALKRTMEEIQSGAFDAPDGEVQRLRAIEQAIRDFQPTKEQQAGYDALVAWLESTTTFVLDSEKGEPNHDT